MSIGDLLKDGRYQIVNYLGKGSQGVVFLVEDLKTKEKYLNSSLLFVILIFNNQIGKQLKE
jgi:hypothetical protein